MPETNDVKERLGQIVGKTYLEHGVGTRPFGTLPNSTRCSYAACCGIGISMSEEVREEVANTDISNLLTAAWVQEDLFSRELEPDELLFAQEVLGELQSEHDDAAEHENRKLYAAYLQQLAAHHDLKLPEPGGKK